MNIYEASDFWDEHDFTEFDDVKEVKNAKFDLARKKSIGVDYKLFNEIEEKARRLHKSGENLINEWLYEKVKQSSRHLQIKR